jgi:hypothetical protein
MKKPGKKPLKWFKMKIDKKIIEELRAANVARCIIEILENKESIVSIIYKAQAPSNKPRSLKPQAHKHTS